MNYQHKSLAAGRWDKLSLAEQLANVGGEVERALKRKEENNTEYYTKAIERAIELLGLSLSDRKNRPHLKEIARAKETLIDYFWGENQFLSSKESWRAYFFQFACAARK